MKNIIKCIAIDDEPLALDVITKFCERIGGIDLKVFSDPAIGLKTIETEQPDLVFLDIEMENISGLSIAERLPKSTCFIFTTAYLNYAMDGFNLDAVDYLHKPFSFARFETAFGKALRRIGNNRPEQPQQKSILVKQEYSNINIPLSEILYVEAMEGYSKIFRTDGRCVVSRIILKKLSALLPENEFLRIHRSYIVSKSKVEIFNKQAVRLSSGMSLPIGRQYEPEVTAALSSASRN